VAVAGGRLSSRLVLQRQERFASVENLQASFISAFSMETPAVLWLDIGARFHSPTESATRKQFGGVHGSMRVGRNCPFIVAYSPRIRNFQAGNRNEKHQLQLQWGSLVG
jgi:hypothetical protein